jgi:hypothetical protein
MGLQTEILKTLLYYDIWSHPLDVKELYTFLPVNSMTLEQFQARLANEANPETIHEYAGYFFIRGKSIGVVEQRAQRERHARILWRIARVSTFIIKQFPFVRAVFISGDLSKNSTHKKSDIDFFIVTEPDRLWICRTLLVMFKKIFLFNNKRFFCVNSFVTTYNLTLDEQNIYLATEVATLKPLYNTEAFSEYIDANSWIKKYFPNFDPSLIELPKTNNRRSWLQYLLEIPFRAFDATRLDILFMQKMETIWAKRYPAFDAETRLRIFRCTRSESRAYVGNFQDKILALYNQRLRDFGILN